MEPKNNGPVLLNYYTSAVKTVGNCLLPSMVRVENGLKLERKNWAAFFQVFHHA